MRLLVSCWLLAISTSASADVDKAGAEAAWQEGRTLAQAGKFAEACPKFEASERMDPAIGTELNLADCYERLGRYASAWAMFKQAADNAHKTADDREQEAVTRATVLEPKLSRLTIQLPKEAIVGLVVTRNGVTVEVALLGSSLPVDPGAVKIECHAPGRRAWTQELTIKVGESLVAAVPNLPVETSKAVANGTSDLQITVEERGEAYEIEVATTGGPMRCEGQVSHDRPCKLTAPPGPAVISVRGALSLKEDITLKGKPVLISVDKTNRILLYSGVVSAGLGAVALGAGLYACSTRGERDISDGTATGLTCIGGSTLGAVGLLAGGGLVIADLMSSHRAISIETEDDDEGVAIRSRTAPSTTAFATPVAGGAAFGISGSF